MNQHAKAPHGRRQVVRIAVTRVPCEEMLHDVVVRIAGGQTAFPVPLAVLGCAEPEAVRETPQRTKRD